MTLAGFEKELCHYIGFDGFTPDDVVALMRWIKYKYARISQLSFKELVLSYREHKHMLNNSTDACASIIRESIARGYKGIAWELPAVVNEIKKETLREKLDKIYASPEYRARWYKDEQGNWHPKYGVDFNYMSDDGDIPYPEPVKRGKNPSEDQFHLSFANCVIVEDWNV